VWGMGGIPHSTRDANSRERGAQPEASTASEGSASNRDEKTWRLTTNIAVVTNRAVVSS
jgi:hypothetical protein